MRANFKNAQIAAISACFLFTLFLLCSCQSAEKSVEKSEDGPRTLYGQKVQEAHELEDENDKRNEELSDQADELFGEE